MQKIKATINDKIVISNIYYFNNSFKLHRNATAVLEPHLPGHKLLILSWSSSLTRPGNCLDSVRGICNWFTVNCSLG